MQVKKRETGAGTALARAFTMFGVFTANGKHGSMQKNALGEVPAQRSARTILAKDILFAPLSSGVRFSSRFPCFGRLVSGFAGPPKVRVSSLFSCLVHLVSPGVGFSSRVFPAVCWSWGQSNENTPWRVLIYSTANCPPPKARNLTASTMTKGLREILHK